MSEWDYGLSNIVIRNIRYAIKQSNIRSEEELADVIRVLKIKLDNSYEELSALVEIRQLCKHEYDAPTFSIQRRVVGHVTVYERKCKVCGYRQKQTEQSEGKPGWAEGAKETYYNNSI